MKHLLILAIGLTMNYTLSAQFGMGKPKEIKELSERKMLVIVEELSKKAADRLRKKGKEEELADIQQRYTEFNAMVKDIVAKRWTMHQEVEYKTWAEFKKMSEKRREKYGVMYFMSNRASNFRAGYLQAGYTILSAETDEKDVKEHDFSSLFQTFTIDKAEDALKMRATPVYSVNLPELYPTALSVTHAILSTNTYFEKRLSGEKVTRKSLKKEIAVNSQRLAQKTLLIAENSKDDDLSLARIKEIYPYPVRVVSEKELGEIVASCDSSYAWLAITPIIGSNSRTNSVIFIQSIVDNADGDICGMDMPGMGSMMLASYTSGTAGKANLTEKTLSAMVKDMETSQTD